MPLGAINSHERISDPLNNFRFWLMDVSFQNPAVFSLGYGFKSCTAPSIRIETETVKHGTFEFGRSYIKSADVEVIRLEQGVRFFQSDFYDWISEALPGRTNMRRNLLLLQFADIAPGNALGLAGNTSNSNALFNPAQLLNSVIPVNDLLSRIPARAWLLRDCIPIGYKAGTDFDALGSDISLAELEIKPGMMDEFNFGI